MKAEIISGLEKSHSYTEFRALVLELLGEGKSSGNEQTPDLLNYSQLNQARMNRLDKTLVVPDEVTEQLVGLQKEYVWLVLAEGWCGDAAQILPILNKMSLVTENIDLRVVFRDENESLMQCFLTNGSRSIPKLIILDKKNHDFVAMWGPRPEGASNLIKEYKAKHGVVDQTAKTELQMWYLNDKGVSTMNEIVAVMLDKEG